MTTLLERFIPEAREYLESAAQGLLKLERTPSSESLVNEVFRAVHTLKGTSGLFDMPGLTRVVHAGEDLLGAVRSHQLTLDSAMVDALLDGLDKVSAWVDDWNGTAVCPMKPKAFRSNCPGGFGRCCRKPTKPRARAGRRRRELQADWLGELRGERPSRGVRRNHRRRPPRCSPYPMCRMKVASIAAKIRSTCSPGRRPEGIAGVLPRTTGAAGRDRSVPLRPGFRALVGQPRGEVEHLFRYVIEQVAIVAVPPETLILPAGDDDGGPGDRNSSGCQTTVTARDFAGLRIAVAGVLERNGSPVRVASALRWLDAVVAAPLPNAAWAAALVNSSPTATHDPSGSAAPRTDCGAGCETAQPPAVETAASDRPMAARILDEQMRIIGMPGDARRQSSAGWRRSRPRSTICWPVSAGRPRR